MRRKGQMTLEIVIMLLLVINIFVYVSQPIGEVTGQASRSIGTTALAVKAVDNIHNKVNLIGISGDGAKDYIEIDVREEFGSFSCGTDITLDFEVMNQTTIVDINNSLGVFAYLKDEIFTYSKKPDFSIKCDATFTDLSTSGNYRACIWFENNGSINIFAANVSDSRSPC